MKHHNPYEHLSPDELQKKRDQAILACIEIILEHRRKRLAREAQEKAAKNGGQHEPV